MKQQDAVDLIRSGFDLTSREEIWVDIGCGKGTFTFALSSMLRRGSEIYAIDKSLASLHSLPGAYQDIKIQKMQLDFITDKFPFGLVDGILMANSLHYIMDKPPFLDKILNNLTPDGKLIIIEYEAIMSNPMVPYPIRKVDLKHTLEAKGMNDFRTLGEKPSRYGHMIYSISCRKIYK